jgi:DNA-binding GntR family transcriptional regulator
LDDEHPRHACGREERLEQLDDLLEILDTVLDGDADAAAAFMRAHVQRSARVVRERVGQALSRMFEEPGS